MINIPCHGFFVGTRCCKPLYMATCRTAPLEALSLSHVKILPNVKDRLKTKITITPHFTAFVTSHGKTKSYLLN